MTPQSLVRLLAVTGALASSALLSAQVLLPSVPPRQFGGSVTPAFEGWFDNPDGSHSFLIGYYSRNTKAELDVPLGPNNHFEPGDADMGQPTHFLPGRRYGMFTFTVPKDFPKNQKLTWVLTVNGITSRVPFYMSPDYNISPFKASEEASGGGYNAPPSLSFVQGGEYMLGPLAHPSRALTRTAVAGVPMVLDLWAEDDAKFSTANNAPLRSTASPVTAVVSKYRGPGEVIIKEARLPFQALKGGKPDEAFSGRATTTVTFSEPGDYVLQVTANDYSGNGGGGSGCCWTNALVKVAVGASAIPTTTGGN